MVEPGASGRPTVCPDCGGPVRPGLERLCPRCGFPLMFLRAPAGPGEAGPARVPGERDEATSVLPIPRTGRAARFGETTTDGVAPLAGGETLCPRCGERNPPERIRCQRCGLELRAVQRSLPPPLETVPPRPAPAPGARRWWPLVAAVIGAVVLVGGAALVAATEPDLFGSRAPESAPQAPGLVQVDRASVRASASSTSDDPRFAVGNLVDGDGATAWQSDGRRVRSNIGVRLRFRFAAPVRLARITVINGYARSPEDYRNNERLARIRVSGGERSTVWRLADTAAPQALDVDAGTLTEVTVEVLDVYPGDRFPDLAVTELAFERRQ